MKNFLLLSLFALSLIACDQVNPKAVESAKLPLTAVEINLQVLDLAKQGKPIEALKLGEDFLRSGSDPEGSLHATLARIYADVGDPESSVRHLQKITGSAGRTSMTLIVNHQEAPAPQPVPVTPPAVSAGVGAASNGASAVIGPNGIEVRAGDASASVRN